MAMKLPPGTTVIPKEDTLLCRCFQEAGAWKAGSSIIVPDTARRESFFAEIIAAGPGKTVDVDANEARIRIPPLYGKGEFIVFSRYHGDQVEIGDELFVLLKEGDILASIHMPEDLAGQFYKPTIAGEGEDSVKAALDNFRASGVV